MRPTDENQAASTRPNLMSSRRGAGEENILAMLERDSARRPSTRMSGVRLASYGAAAALVGILAGGVAWLAWDNHRTGEELQTQYDLANNPSSPAMAEADLPPILPPAAAPPAPVAEAPRTAVIVDEAARTREAASAAAPPPLVMLPPHELAGAKAPPPAQAPRPAQESVQARPGIQPKLVKAEPPKVAAKPVKAEAPKAAPRPAAEKKADKPAKLASRGTKPAPARTSTKAKASPEAARPRKAAATADTPVDSDVALISAIIQHAERHRGEREPCSGPKCPPKPTRP